MSSGNVVFRKRSPTINEYRERRERRFKEGRAGASLLGRKIIRGKRRERKVPRFGPIPKETLLDLYLQKGNSMREVAEKTGFSLHKVSYWMEGYKIKKRTVSEAIYINRNRKGDPFQIHEPGTMSEAQLMGMGLGLFWGEGTKMDKNSIRLGNTDPALIKTFVKFLKRFFEVDNLKIHFGLQIFNDTNPDEVLRFWMKELDVNKSQFQKVVVTPSRGAGTYRRKMKYGVLTVYFNNKKLRGVIAEKLKAFGYSGD